MARLFLPNWPLQAPAWLVFHFGSNIAQKTGAGPDISTAGEIFAAALAIPVVNFGDAVLHVGLSATAGDDDTFGEVGTRRG